MITKKKLYKLGIFLFILNLLVASFAMYNHIQIEEKLAESSENSKYVMGVKSTPIFDKNYIMSNEDLKSTRAFPTEQSVQTYLERVDSPLKNYTNQGKRASYWIFGAARGQTSSKWGVVPNINPAVILSYLEKEQSLLSLSNYDTLNDPNNRLKTAMGYGCPDTAKCDTQYYGFANQVNWAAYQLQFNYNISTNQNYTDAYKVGNTITTLDEYNVFLTNEATAIQYRYTPHVYWGNYNLWKIMKANGWGVSSVTYKMSDIDAVNLGNSGSKQEGDSQNDSEIIYRSDIEYLLSKEWHIGESSEDIKTIQAFLRQEGYYMNRAITGMYGVVTDQSLRNYRSDNGIITKTPTAECLRLINSQWTFGEESERVKNLQSCLRDLGIFNFPTDTGYFGTVTQSSLQKTRDYLKKKAEQPKTRCELLRDKSWSIGMRSQEVRDLQDCMTDLGYFTWKYGSTGYYGEVSQTALNKWKAALVEEEEEKEEVITEQPKTRCELLRDKSWSIGMRSQEVKDLQDCMTDLGYFTWKYGSTGYYGQVTNDSLVNWRQW